MLIELNEHEYSVLSKVLNEAERIKGSYGIMYEVAGYKSADSFVVDKLNIPLGTLTLSSAKRAIIDYFNERIPDEIKSEHVRIVKYLSNGREGNSYVVEDKQFVYFDAPDALKFNLRKSGFGSVVGINQGMNIKKAGYWFG